MTITEEEIKELGFNDLKKINEMIKLLQKQKEYIEEEDKKELIITDHAAVRYMERVKGINIKEEIRQHLIRSKTKFFYDQMGTGTYGVAEGLFKAKISDNCVKTIYQNK